MKTHRFGRHVFGGGCLRGVLIATALSAAMTIGCGHTGFVALSEPAPPASPAKPLPMYASRDIGRPYEVLGYVFRSTEGHKSGLVPMDAYMYVLSPSSEEMTEVRREALAKGADAIVGLEMFPTLNGFGQPVGFSVGGLAVKFADQAPAAASAVPASPASATPDVQSKTAPLEEPEPPPTDEAEPASGETDSPDAIPALPAP